MSCKSFKKILCAVIALSSFYSMTSANFSEEFNSIINWTNTIETFKKVKEKNIENLIQQVSSAVQAGDKETLINITLRYKDDIFTLEFINKIIEELKKEIELKRKILQENLEEKQLVEEIKKLWKASIIIDRYNFQDITLDNGHFKGQCTWFAAAKAFPKISDKKQEKLWNGNAWDWLALAKNKGYKVSLSPKVWDVVVFKWGNYSTLGHVGIVTEVKDLTITVEDMNFSKNRLEVTKRINLKDDKAIAGYITTNTYNANLGKPVA